MTAYNQVVKDFAETVNSVMTETIYAATRLHLLKTDPGLYQEMLLSERNIVFDIPELMASTDERVLRIMLTYHKAEEAMNQLKAYWMTTAEWIRGEEL